MSSDQMELEEKSDEPEKLSKSFKDNIIQALEELRIKRKMEVTNTERINQLLREKFEIDRKKDEVAREFQKEIVSLTQKLAEGERELQETKEKLLCLERKHKSTENYENEGIKVLKEEIIALQLAKHNLEKKMKEQDYQYNLQSTAKENLMKQLKVLQDRVKSVEEQRDKTQHELMNIESSVQKVTLFQNRILRINSHQQCSLERLKSDLAIANEELLKARVTIDKFNSNIRRLEEKESYEAARKITEPKHDLVKEKLEEHIEQLKKENDRLLQELNKQADLANHLNNRLITISTSEMGLHFVIDDLKAENAKLKSSIDGHDVADKEIQTAEQKTAEQTTNESEEKIKELQEDEMSRDSVPSPNTATDKADSTAKQSNVSQEIADISQTGVRESEIDIEEKPLS